MYGCESWIIKKTEHWRIDAFDLWCWRRLLSVSWTARRANQLILKGMSPEYSLEGLRLKQKLQYFGHLIQRANCLEKTDSWKDWRQDKKGMTDDEMVGWHHQFNGHEFEQALGVGDGQGSLACYCPWGHKESDKTERLNWTKLKHLKKFLWLQCEELIILRQNYVKNDRIGKSCRVSNKSK